MAGNVGTLEFLAQQVGLALQPLEAQLAPANIIPFFEELGLKFPPQLASQSGFMSAVGDASSAAGALTALLTQLSTDIGNQDDEAIVKDGVQLIGQIGKIVSALSAIGTQLGNISSALPGLTQAEVATFAANFAEGCLSYSLIFYFETNYPGFVGVANLIGVVNYAHNPGTPGDPTHPPYVVRSLQLSNIAKVFSGPADLLRTLFDWGSPSFDGTKLIPALSETLRLIGLSPQVNSSGPPSQLSTSLLNLKVNSASNPPGLLATVNSPISSPINLSLPLSATWSINFQISGNFASGIGATLTPPMNYTFKPPSGVLSGQLQTTFSTAGAGNPLVIFGETGGSVLQADSVAFGGGVNLNWDPSTNLATADPSVTFGVTNGKLVIDMSEADGFLSDVTGGTPIQATFGFNATWAPDTGLHITGGAQLEIDLPLHIDLGPVTIETIYVIAGVASDGLTLELAAALGVTLGPIQASVDKVGLSGTLSFPQGGGNLGPANLALGFKPPDGLGLEIDAGPASGGGYISFDPSQGQYAGVLDVSLMDVVQVKIIGVIDTIMPDGSSGFSFILIITFDLPPIELGFGFTLNGVGGLGGVNRTIDTNALQAGFVAHSLNSILFPPDPVANAPAIISNIRNFFPVAQGIYVFGPMMEIGWGEPTLITIEIGVILELPSPVVIVLLGLVDVALPDADAALVQIHIDVLGTLDFGTKTLEIEGDMYDSSVLIYSMAGSLFFRICWGDDPNFIYSVGGFNPNFNTAGLDIPAQQRCSVSIGDGDNPRISANNYFAVTSNSLQFGANVQAYASAAGFTIQGYLGFDVLIVFSPFSFEFDFNASFSASFEGVNLLSLSVSGSISGPRPWNLNGSASISILFWTVSASVNLTWGDSTPVTLPQKAVLPDLVTALEATGNWSAALPAGMTPAVSLTAPTPSQSAILVYPMGTLSVRENVVPLDVPISRYGNATPSDGSLFAIGDVQINGVEVSWQTFQEYFAPGQFNALSDADKLSLPSFELYDAGVTIGSNAVVSGQDSARTVVYEESYIDAPMSYSRPTGVYLMGANLNSALMRQGAGFASPVANTGFAKFAATLPGAGAAIATVEQGFVVADTNDLSVRADISSASGVTYFQARAALAAHLSSNPSDTGNLQIVTLYEAAA
jgi:hypothetical protein